MAIGQVYIPLQVYGEPPVKDMDAVFAGRYGVYRVVVKDCIIVEEEFLSDGAAPVSTWQVCE